MAADCAALIVGVAPDLGNEAEPLAELLVKVSLTSGESKSTLAAGDGVGLGDGLGVGLGAGVLPTPPPSPPPHPHSIMASARPELRRIHLALFIASPRPSAARRGLADTLNCLLSERTRHSEFGGETTVVVDLD